MLLLYTQQPRSISSFADPVQGEGTMDRDHALHLLSMLPSKYASSQIFTKLALIPMAN